MHNETETAVMSNRHWTDWLQVDWRDRYWRTWLATLLLLYAGMAGALWCYLIAMGLTLVQVVMLLHDGHEPESFPVQVRVGYYILLCIGLLPVLSWVAWLPALGTPVMLLFGYCPLARFMVLMPWNRKMPLDASLLRRVLFTPPGRGMALDLLHAPAV